MAPHLLHALHYVATHPAWTLTRFGGRLRPPLWLRTVAGVLAPPWTGLSRFRSVYVVTYGRSGSTLLTGYLTHLPGFDIKGENYLFPLPLAEADRRLTAAAKLQYSGRDLPASPWYGSHMFNLGQWRRDMRRAILNQLYPIQAIPKTIGFKEIRWWYRLDAESYEQQFAWLTSVRKPGAIVFLTRDLDKTMAGAWWAKQSDDERAASRAGLEHFEGYVRAYAHAHPDHSIHLTYEHFCADSEEAKRLCRFLGVKFSEDVYKQTMGERYSYPSAQSQDV